MNVWAYVLDWLIFQIEGFELKRRERKSLATSENRALAVPKSSKDSGNKESEKKEVTRKVDGTVVLNNVHERCYIESSKPGETMHRDCDTIKLGHLMFYGLVAFLNRFKLKPRVSAASGAAGT